MIHNHRQVYRVIKDALLEGSDKKLLASVEMVRKEGFGWRYDGLGDWSTDAIFDQLKAFGIDTGHDRFEQQARAAGRTLVLEEQWRKGVVIDDKTPWDDFPFLACEELWKRLTPHLLCPEIVASRIESVIGRPAADIDDYRNATDGRDHMEAASVLVNYLETFNPDKREAAFEEVLNCSTYNFGEWLIDIALDFGRNNLRMVRRIAEVMSETVFAECLWADLAQTLVQADQFDEAVEQVRINKARWPHSVWIQIQSGDVHRDLGNFDQAMQLYTKALKSARSPYDWEGVAERVRPLLSRQGRHEEWDRLEQAHPKPADPSIIPYGDAVPGPSPGEFQPGGVGRIGVLTSDPSPRLLIDPGMQSLGAKVGRNESCPCGSGKKYKKCCMDAK